MYDGPDAGSVAVINPEHGYVEPFIWIGDGPRYLALSEDGRYLWVGVDGENRVRATSSKDANNCADGGDGVILAAFHVLSPHSTGKQPMRKLALRLDDLSVETFHPASETPVRGTVVAAADSDPTACADTQCCYSAIGTCPETCLNTCGCDTGPYECLQTTDCP